ncbi:MAG: alpha/beta fold hydrolase [Actinomycetota bacterium]|nr:alpha/beta fold hydrolase [Actinomycetota bacterium]
MTTPPPDVCEHRRSIDGIEHRWLERGDGRPVVLVHGIPTSAELWRHVMPLVDGARLLAWEMPGYGRSWAVPPGVDISVDAQAGRLLAWLDELIIDRAVLVGHDLGGGVAQIAAVRSPERCAALVLTNAVAYDSWPIPEVKAMRAAGPLVERLPGPLLRGQLAALFHMGHDDRDRARESLEVHWTGYDHAQGATALVRQMRSLDCRDTEAVASALPSLGVPAALVWGAADRFQKLDPYGRRLAADLGSSVDEVQGAKHFTPEDHPERIAAAITRVLGELAAT